ncbi:MAG: hypothetical protein P8P74_09400 [Crocinitomicaceae bacterium]|nr:hypothetical protein [Crocinitomicaceae bacterium]
MKQSFHFTKDKFCSLTMKLINIRQPSFLTEKNIEDTLMNCLVAIEGEKSVQIENIFFTESEKIVPNGLSPVADVNFTLSKNEDTKNTDFLKIIAKFNS